jgi:Kef-type K+ transport system membrane component KefB
MHPPLLAAQLERLVTVTLTHFLIAVAVILATCHLFGSLADRLHQPPVVGEILGALLLGPSALGLLWPAVEGRLFPPTVLTAVQMAAQLGLAAFVFLVGAEVRTEHVRGRGGTIGLVVAGAMGPAFAVGVLIAIPAHHLIAGSAADAISLPLFFGLAMSITALPVLALVLTHLRIEATFIGAISLTASGVGDGVAWGVLTVILTTTAGGGAAAAALRTAVAAGLIGAALLVVRPLLTVAVRQLERRGSSPQLLLPILAAGAIAFAAATQLIGLHPGVGAFMFGIAVPRRCDLAERLNLLLRGFTVTILLPLFFAWIGLSISIGLLATPASWLVLAAVVLAGTAAKFLGTSAGASLAGIPAKEAFCLGALMNCRGVTELIVASIGWSSHILNALGLTVLTLMALITTAMTGPVARKLLPQPVPAEAAAGRS